MEYSEQEKNAETENEQMETVAQNGAPRDGGAGDPSTDEQFSEQLAQAQAQAAEYLDNWRRSMAELSNARKRMQREQADFAASANARLLEKLIPVIDDVDRAFAALPPDVAAGEWVNGFRLIQRKLQALLESEGVSIIPAVGQKFDPTVHYAVSHEQQEGFEDGDVIAEVAKGYKLGDKVLRPVMVRVAKG